MLTFNMIDFAIVLVGAVILLAGITFLALRRRDEILQDFLTPDEPDIEAEFFKKHPVAEEKNEVVSEQATTDQDAEALASWGDITPPEG